MHSEMKWPSWGSKTDQHSPRASLSPVLLPLATVSLIGLAYTTGWLIWRRQWHPLSILAWKNPMDGGAWWAAVHGVTKSWTRLRDFTFTFHFPALEKEMATHSSVLAWRIPGTGGGVEPGGLPSVGPHRVGHN